MAKRKQQRSKEASIEVQVSLARPFLRPAHIHLVGAHRGRWCAEPKEGEVELNPLLSTPKAAAATWGVRWRNAVTGRHNYALVAPAEDDLRARTFDAAARFGEDLQRVREAIAVDVLDARSAFHREAVQALLCDTGHFGLGAPEEAVQSMKPAGDRALVRAVDATPLKGAPREEEVNGYLGHLQPGLTVDAIAYFHSVCFALPVVGRLDAYLTRHRLAPRDALLLTGGFRVEGPEDEARLQHARALGWPEVRFPTRKAGVVHLCTGALGRVAADLWNTVPVTSLLGPATLYLAVLNAHGALEGLADFVRPPQGVSGTAPLAVCELAPGRPAELRSSVTLEEAAAVEWFWEQGRRPRDEEEAFLEFLVRRVAVTREESKAPERATTRAASRLNRVVPAAAAKQPPARAGKTTRKAKT